MRAIADLGVRLSVDGFGTGYSSLSYLERLPVQEVEIDQSFVTGLREHGEDVAIVRAIVDSGRPMPTDALLPWPATRSRMPRGRNGLHVV